MYFVPNALCFAIVLISLMAGPVRAAFYPIPAPPGGAYSDLKATAISADGSVVVGVGVNGANGFRWSESEGFQPLSNLAPYAVSGDGSVIAGADVSLNAEAFRQAQGSSAVALGFLSAEGTQWSKARGVSADGTIVVGVSQSQAFRWTESEGMVSLGGFWGSDWGWPSVATAVSADGSVIVGWSAADIFDYTPHAFRWTASNGMTMLDESLLGQWHGATAISSDGSVIAGWINGEAFRWSETDGMIGLGNLPGYQSSIALGVSGSGAVIVGAAGDWLDVDVFGYNYVQGAEVAVIWDAVHGIRSLRDVLIAQGDDLTGWTLYEATAISADGRTIVGWGYGPDSNSAQAFVATINPVPEPSSLVLAAFGLVGTLLILWRRGRCGQASGTP